MKIRFNMVVLTGLTLMLVLSACGGDVPATEPPPSQPAPTEQLPTLEPSAEPAPVIPSPTLVPVNLSGPGVGTKMSWADNSVMVFVPAGDFTMGNNAFDAPEHTVYLSDYWIYQTEVTNSMYAFCVSAGACAPPYQELGAPFYENPIYDNYPIVGVSWDQAANYCAWIGGSLPTEAQWEKAARGSNGASYPWGNAEPSCELGNFSGCVGALTDVTKYDAGASPYGALDMAGNVLEWVNDFYGESYYTSAPIENPTGPTSGESRVARGSGFETSFNQALSAIRRPAGNAFHNRDLGFRCVIQQPPALAPMCQTSAYIPRAEVSVSACQVPNVNVSATYCESKRPYTNVELDLGATFEVKTQGFTCSDAVVNGQRRLTCSGLDGTTGNVRVCNEACSSLPDNTGAAPECDSGYGLDANTGTCLYSPISAQPGVAGCPRGFVLTDRGGQAFCAPGMAGDGLCPDGTYFDIQYGACVSPSAGIDAPYGLNAPEQAANTYQGCLPGFSYAQEYQCCQPSQGGVYPGCPLGTRYDTSQNVCIPDEYRLSGPGCVTVSVNMLQCNEPYQIRICEKIKDETACIKNQVYDCKWIDDSYCEYTP